MLAAPLRHFGLPPRAFPRPSRRRLTAAPQDEDCSLGEEWGESMTFTRRVIAGLGEAIQPLIIMTGSPGPLK
jgi:hypothetical protein